MPVRKLKNGRYKADIKDKFRGIPRTRKTFDTRKEADEWYAAVLRDGTSRLLGNRARRIFGEALAKYLREESPKKLTHVEDLSNAAALRWPFWNTDTKRWQRLEESDLVEVPADLARWTADLRAVRDRRYLDNRLFHLRPRADGRLAWFEQPSAKDGARPEPRREVINTAFIGRLEEKPGRGPFATATLRVRQLLVSSVLRCAWKHWSTDTDKWLDQDIAGKIKLEAAAMESDEWADYDTLLALLIAAPVGFDDAILAAGMIGWRRANILGGHKKHRPTPPLGWDHVVFPVYKEDPQTGDRVELQHGYFWVDRPHTKKKKPLAQPMSELLLQLFAWRWEQRNGPHVFHRGNGKPFSNFKRMWASTKRRAGVDPKFRWHSLRHTFATLLLRAGADPRHVQELGGWQDGRSMARYDHMRMDHLRDTVNISRRTQ